MATYGTKEYYEEQLAQSKLEAELIEEALIARLNEGTFKVRDIIPAAGILQTMDERIVNAKKQLEEYVRKKND